VVQPLTAEEGRGLGIPYLRGLWSRTLPNRAAASPPPDDGAAGDRDGASWERDQAVIHGLSLGLRETLSYLHEREPSFEEFERWIVAMNGGSVDPRTVARINAALANAPAEAVDSIGDGASALTADELAFFDEHGYVVLRNAVEPAAARAAEDAIWAYLDMDRDDPGTWYTGRNVDGIWVPLVHHPALDANRASPRIAAAFAQLWKRRDLWHTIDQCGFNPPERPGWRFRGYRLHWDVGLVPPVPFGVQGILYLVDVAPDQGAFTCVPGFHRRIDGWLRGLPPDADPRNEDLSALKTVAVGARAGDLVIWHQALPHGASPNRAARPRIVQYVSLYAATRNASAAWR
jgi:phytanoyl-CoA dioxygenase PhyH